MKSIKQIGLCIVAIAGLYLLLPLLLFDFTSVATPYDEEYFGAQKVAIGPRPHWWVLGAARHIDIPGGADYDPSGWPFVVWKPLCVAYVKAKGYALPSEWR